MVKTFEGKNYWALILGGSTGLGLASALKLAAQGMNICIVHRNGRSELHEIEQSFQEISNKKTKLLTFNMDAMREESYTEIIGNLQNELGNGRIRCLLHSIAKGNLKPMADVETPNLTAQDFILTLQHMAINLYDWTKAIHQAGLFAADARVISFTSEGSTKAWKHYAAVSAAKAALEAITRNIALEFAPFGIRANCIQAGITDTASLQKIPGSDLLKQHSIVRNPFKRLTLPQDVANAVYLLCLDEAAWINGAIIPVDGGEHIS